MPELGIKVFFIGFNKCGTRSFSQLFWEAGLNAYHGSDEDPLYRQIPRNIDLARKCLYGFENYDAYSDSEKLSYSFRRLDKDYPDSRFVLNTRDINRWIVSRLNHGEGRYIDFVNQFEGKNLTWHEWVEVWRARFISHEKQVIEYFRGRDDTFLIFNIETDPLRKFNCFIGTELVPGREKLPHFGLTAKKFFAADGERIYKVKRA
jgi:hypothetical protein